MSYKPLATPPTNTTGVTPTTAGTGTSSSTSQQALMLTSQFSQLSKDQSFSQLNLAVPDKLVESLKSFFATGSGAVSGSGAVTTNIDNSTKLLESLPANVKSWMVAALNQHQSQNGLPTLTAGQWVVLFSKLQLSNTSAHVSAHTSQSSDPQKNAIAAQLMLQINWLTGGKSAASIKGDKSDMLSGLLKMLIPIQLQDKASLIIKEQARDGERGSDRGSDGGSDGKNEQGQQKGSGQEQQKGSGQQHNPGASSHTEAATTESPDNSSDKGSTMGKSSGSGSGANSALHFTLQFDLKPLGMLSIELHLNDFELRTLCICNNKLIEKQVLSYWPQLNDRLTKFGFSVSNQIEVQPQHTDFEDISGKGQNKSSGLIDIKV